MLQYFAMVQGHPKSNEQEQVDTDNIAAPEINTRGQQLSILPDELRDALAKRMAEFYKARRAD